MEKERKKKRRREKLRKEKGSEGSWSGIFSFTLIGPGINAPAALDRLHTGFAASQRGSITLSISSSGRRRCTERDKARLCRLLIRSACRFNEFPSIPRLDILITLPTARHTAANFVSQSCTRRYSLCTVYSQFRYDC